MKKAQAATSIGLLSSWAVDPRLWLLPTPTSYPPPMSPATKYRPAQQPNKRKMF